MIYLISIWLVSIMILMYYINKLFDKLKTLMIGFLAGMFGEEKAKTIFVFCIFFLVLVSPLMIIIFAIMRVRNFIKKML